MLPFIHPFPKKISHKLKIRKEKVEILLQTLILIYWSFLKYQEDIFFLHSDPTKSLNLSISFKFSNIINQLNFGCFQWHIFYVKFKFSIYTHVRFFQQNIYAYENNVQPTCLCPTFTEIDISPYPCHVVFVSHVPVHDFSANNHIGKKNYSPISPLQPTATQEKKKIEELIYFFLPRTN